MRPGFAVECLLNSEGLLCFLPQTCRFLSLTGVVSLTAVPLSQFLERNIQFVAIDRDLDVLASDTADIEIVILRLRRLFDGLCRLAPDFLGRPEIRFDCIPFKGNIHI